MPTLRVLLVDDQSSILMLVQVMLERALPGVRVRTAKSATDALYALQQEPSDVVLSDVSMPGEDGFFRPQADQTSMAWPSSGPHVRIPIGPRGGTRWGGWLSSQAI